MPSSASTRRGIKLNECLWIRSGSICAVGQQNPLSETRALQERGAQIYLLKNPVDQADLEKLKRLLWQSDTHVVLSWLHPKELDALRPILNERKNFSLLTDDWYIHPYWVMRDAEYLMFRKYSGIAARLGHEPFLSGGRAPLLLDPRPDLSRYPITCALLRPAVLAASPFVDAWRWWQRHQHPVDPAKLLYFPFAIEPSNVPLSNIEPKYDFANTGGTIGIFLLRDAYTPFRHSFANLYHDRKVLTDTIAKFENNPFTFYDCRREKKRLPYAEYIRKNQESRYLIASGGLHDATVPKYTEYACQGTPMIGRSLPFDYPWLDDCLFPVDMLNVTPENIKPLLQQALDCYPKLRQNCLNWRERLLKLYDLQTIFDMVQEQADGKPIRPGYLKKDLKQYDPK